MYISIYVNTDIRRESGSSLDARKSQKSNVVTVKLNPESGLNNGNAILLSSEIFITFLGLSETSIS